MRLCVWVLFLSAFGLAQAYLPLEAGRTWVYSDGTVQKVVSRQGDGVVLEYTKEASFRRDRLRLKDGVWLLGVELPQGVFAYAPPLLLYPGRLEVGASWSSRGVFQGQTVALSGRVEAVEGVEALLGRFNAYRLRLAYTTKKGGTGLVELYLVPGLGVVRYLSGGRPVDLVKTAP